MKKLLAFRFDVDSVRCIEEGIPKLMDVGQRRGVRFSFFVNMGYSFNWAHNLRHFAKKRLGPKPVAVGPAVRSLPTKQKLGVAGVLKTMFLNPRLGDRYKSTFDGVHAAGHELALHGGTDHVVWQRSLGQLSDTDIDALLRPAYETFSERYGEPRGFACPGFVYNETVLSLLDQYGFKYSSDMPGEEPFHPRVGDRHFSHYQVPVNVAGEGNVPIIEQSLALGRPVSGIIDTCVEMISRRDFAMLYGHPYVEGVRAEILDAVLGEVESTHEVVTVEAYLDRWLARA